MSIVLHASKRFRRRLLLLACIALAILSLDRLRRARLEILRRGQRWLECRFSRARASLAHHVDMQVEAALDRAARHLKAHFKDHSMPLILQRAIDHAMDLLIPEVRQETFRVLDENLRFLQAGRLPLQGAQVNFSPLSPRRVFSGLSGMPSHAAFDLAGGSSAASGDGRVDGQQGLLLLLRRGRATMLHTLWPHDRTVWRCVRSPYWWLLELLGVLPWVGMWWWLLLAAAVDKADEYQLCQFIVALRFSHFATLGVGATLYACIQSYRCTVDATLPCQALAPQLSTLDACFWMLQLAITLRAFMLLPHSLKKGQRVLERRSRLTPDFRAAIAAGQQPAPPDGAPMGGMLGHLMWLDAALASLALLAAVTAIVLADDESAALRITLYWIRTLHGLGSLPYVLFRMPGAMPLLTHARRTGYDSRGHTVPFRDNSTFLSERNCLPVSRGSGERASAASRGSGEHSPVARRLFAEEPLAERGGGLRWVEWRSWRIRFCSFGFWFIPLIGFIGCLGSFFYGLLLAFIDVIDGLRRRLQGLVKALTSGWQQRRMARAAKDAPHMCVICMDAPRTTRFCPCGHSPCCEACAAQIIRLGGGASRCPYCRTSITTMVTDPNITNEATFVRSPCFPAWICRRLRTPGLGMLRAARSVS